jgi:hypothetical protein
MEEVWVQKSMLEDDPIMQETQRDNIETLLRSVIQDVKFEDPDHHPNKTIPEDEDEQSSFDDEVSNKIIETEES